MRRLIPILLLLSLSAPAASTQLKMVRMQPAVGMASQNPGLASLSPSLRTWVSTEARATIDRGAQPDASVVAGNARARLSGQDFSNADIEALVQWVMAESARQAQADLREMTEQMKAVNEGKARARKAAAGQREAHEGVTAAARAEYTSPKRTMACVRPPCKFDVIAIAPDQQQIKSAAPAGTEGSSAAGADPDSDADSVSEMGEMNQLRLQMQMDRRAKFIEALSNLMKKQSETAGTITSNLK